METLVMKRIAELESLLVESRRNAVAARLEGKPFRWVWNWKGGGYNDCVACTEDRARELAAGCSNKMSVNWETFKPMLTRAEYEAWCKSQGCWD